MGSFLELLAAERARIDAKWGASTEPRRYQIPDGTGAQALDREGRVRRDEMLAEIRCENATVERSACERDFREGRGTWKRILREEVAEAIAEDDPERLVAELVQVAAVCGAWVDAIRAREEAGRAP